MRAAEVIGSPLPRDLGLRMARGAAWMIALRWSIRGIGLVSMVILARLLAPADFGLVAIATALSGMLAAMSEFGFQIALIQNQTADRRHYDTAWTLGLIRGVVMAAILSVSAGTLAGIFSDPRLEPIFLLLAIAVIVTSFENIAVVDFRKDLQFQREFVYRALSKSASFAITVPLAVILRSYWALVIGILAGQLTGVLLSYALCRYRPRLSLCVWRELLTFSKWLLLGNVLAFFYQRADTFVIGRLLGAQPLGLFSVAREIASLPASEIVAPIGTALLPGYSKLAAEPRRLRADFASTFGLIVMIAVPLALGLGLTAEPLVRLLLGEQWLGAIPLLLVLCVDGAITACYANTWSVFVALGRPWINMSLTGFGLLLLIPLLVLGAHEAGALGAAWAVCATAAMLLAANLCVTLRLLELSAAELISKTWRSLVALSAMGVAMLLVQLCWPESERLTSDVLLLLTSILVGALTYLSFLWMLWRLTGLAEGPEQLGLRVLRATFREMMPRLARAGLSRSVDS